MISLQRLKIDSWVQLGLGLISFMGWYSQSFGLAIIMFGLLWLWQTGSAIELWLDYRHRSRLGYMWLAPLLFVAYWLHEKAIFLCLAFAVVYAWHTISDYLIVRRRPRSFWDL